MHHALCNIIVPIFERTFISDSYANRKGFGTHRALRRFTAFARSSRYVFQGDIRKYFPSIDHEILKNLIRHKIKCLDTLWLIDAIIDFRRACMEESRSAPAMAATSSEYQPGPAVW